MDNLSKYETEDIIIYTDQIYDQSFFNKCQEFHKQLVKKGQITGDFFDNYWRAFSGVKGSGLFFSVNPELYHDHAEKELKIPVNEIINMLKCYALYTNGVYIYYSISKYVVSVLREFLEQYGNLNYKVEHRNRLMIESFLAFIGISEQNIENIVNSIRLKKNERGNQRQLSPILTYMVIETEINNLYSMELDEDTFVQWFPIFFWVNITFVLPLRATEMLVTPYDCLEYREDGIYLKVRRTCLKGGKKTVYYSVDKDYELFSYKVPNTSVIATIRRYQELTSSQSRRFLFAYNKKTMINNMLSLSSFNHLLESFMNEFIIGNPKYDFARYASNIKEFEAVTAGDSRPIAMANLYFQDAGADICRQLANHVKIDTSAGYYTNVSEIIMKSSIMHQQKLHNKHMKEMEDNFKKSRYHELRESGSLCTAPKREHDFCNIEDCLEQGHLEDCMGCKYYLPSRQELEEFEEKYRKKADESAKKIITAMNNIGKLKNKDISLEELYLKGQTNAQLYRVGCDLKAEELSYEWLKSKNSQKIFS